MLVPLQAAEGAVKAGAASGGGGALPGMIFNAKKKVSYTDGASGEERSVRAGRLECTMQVSLPTPSAGLLLWASLSYDFDIDLPVNTLGIPHSSLSVRSACFPRKLSHCVCRSLTW